MCPPQLGSCEVFLSEVSVRTRVSKRRDLSRSLCYGASLSAVIEGIAPSCFPQHLSSVQSVSPMRHAACWQLWAFPSTCPALWCEPCCAFSANLLDVAGRSSRTESYLSIRHPNKQTRQDPRAPKTDLSFCRRRGHDPPPSQHERPATSTERRLHPRSPEHHKSSNNEDLRFNQNLGRIGGLVCIATRHLPSKGKR